MNAIKMAFFIFAFSIAGGIIASSGIFSTTVETPKIETPSADLATGIMEVDSLTSSTSDLESAFNGGEMLLNILSTVKTIFEVLLLPAPYLISQKVPTSIAYGVQAMVTLSEVWALIQIYRNMSTKGMD